MMLNPPTTEDEAIYEDSFFPELYITNIDPKVNENDLYAFFERYGPINAVKIVREKDSGRSLSYGFVEFENVIDAEVARVKAQYQRIERREILVMFTSERQQLLQEAKIFVKNIPHTAKVNELHDHFAQISPNLFVHINTDEKGSRLNFGFVHYLSVKDAETALEKLQSSELKDSKLQLSPWMAKEIRQIAQTESRRNLYFRNLPLVKKKVIENSLRQILSQFGEIESMLVKKARKLNSYYALVSFKCPQVAQNALKELTANPVTLEGSNEPFHVSWYQRKAEKSFHNTQQLNTVYFQNMKAKINEITVREAFEACGNILYVSMTLYRSKNQKNKGDKGKMKSGYILFEDELQASNAIESARTNKKVQELFVNEPVLELIPQQLLNAVGPFNSIEANPPNLMSYPIINEVPWTYWPFPNTYLSNPFQSYDPYYFSMAPLAYPTGIYPYFVNNMFFMPQCQPNFGYPLISNNYNFYQGNFTCEITGLSGSTENLITDKDTGLTFISNMSITEGGKNSEITSPESNTSTSDETEARTRVQNERVSDPQLLSK